MCFASLQCSGRADNGVSSNSASWQCIQKHVSCLDLKTEFPAVCVSHSPLNHWSGGKNYLMVYRAVYRVCPRSLVHLRHLTGFGFITFVKMRFGVCQPSELEAGFQTT